MGGELAGEPESNLVATTRKFDPSRIMGGLYGAGILGQKKAFGREWVQKMREEVDVLFEDQEHTIAGLVMGEA